MDTLQRLQCSRQAAAGLVVYDRFETCADQDGLQSMLLAAGLPCAGSPISDHHPEVLDDELLKST
jgi:hypothetical protein